jgi:hypothetical protein
MAAVENAKRITRIGQLVTLIGGSVGFVVWGLRLSWSFVASRCATRHRLYLANRLGCGNHGCRPDFREIAKTNLALGVKTTPLYVLNTV